MTLLSISRDFAQSRGLSLTRSALGLLTLCALLCASATAAMGPVAFVGLVAPHMAVMIGARTVKTELCTAALLGAALVSWADWLGQVLIAPAQIPAGTLASIIGARVLPYSFGCVTTVRKKALLIQLAEKYPFQSMFGLSSCVVVNEIFEYEMPGLNFQLR